MNAGRTSVMTLIAALLGVVGALRKRTIKVGDHTSTKDVGSDLDTNTSLLEVATDDAFLANGCPNFLIWKVFSMVAKRTIKNEMKQYLPVQLKHPLKLDNVDLDACTASADVIASIEVDIEDFSVGSIACTSATCSRKTLGVCREWSPMTVSVSMSPSTTTVQASIEGTASCGDDNVDLSGVKVTLAVDDLNIESTISAHLGLSPRSVSEVEPVGFNLTYKAADLQCTLLGFPITKCADAKSFLEAPEFQDELSNTILKGIPYALDMALGDSE